jgi:uncharacterized membrane protein
LLGTLSFATPFGFRIHFFQYLVFLAALIYGPLGGMISGAFGSVYTAMLLNNPYIVIGNIILGGFTGFFARKGLPVIGAAMLAYLIQVPWLWVSDIYWAGMPQPVVEKVVIALLVGNLLWAVLARYTFNQIKEKVIK